MQNSYNSQKAEYAGFWVRLAAYCIDSAVVWIGLIFVKLVIGMLSLSGGTIFRANILFHYTLKDIILYVFQILYFVIFTYNTGTTLGKKALNLRVIHADGSQRLSLINVLYRETIGRFLCGLSIGIGYIMAGVDKEKRGLHDMLCDTRVVYAKKIKVYPVYQAPQGRPMPPMGGQMPPQGPGTVPPWNPSVMPPQGPGTMPPMQQASSQENVSTTESES
ncbi:RDD family protein [Bariatricus sp. SGI.154]|uniref:RDD family protein n=1 Tax=Bariatricus sp. SGI.154 TaxID=3420549 RepID=UPI003D01B13C